MRATELAALPLAERLHTMEVLWRALDDDVQSSAALPGWHQDVVAERLDRLRDGKVSIVDLEEAFERIASAITSRRSGGAP